MQDDDRGREASPVSRAEAQAEQDWAALLARREFELAKEVSSRGKIRWAPPHPASICTSWLAALSVHHIPLAGGACILKGAFSESLSSALPERWVLRVLPTLVYILVQLTGISSCFVCRRRPRPGHYPLDFSPYRMRDAKERHDDPSIALYHR